MKKIVRLSSIIIMLSLLIACSSQLPKSADSLVVWDFKYVDIDMKAELAVIDSEFTRRNPGISVKHRGYPDTEYVPRLRAALLAGTGPDIMWLHPGMEFFTFTENLLVLDDLNSEFEQIFLPTSLDICRDAEGSLRGIPITFQGMGIYYNKRVLADAGVEAPPILISWEEFLRICEKLKQAGKIPIAYGNNPTTGSDFLRRMLQVSYFSNEELANFHENGWGVSSGRFREITEMLFELREKEYMPDEYSYRPHMFYSRELFLKGNAGFVFGLLSDTLHWKEFSDGQGKNSIGYIASLTRESQPYPGRQLIQPAGIISSINASTQNKSIAKKYLKWYTSESVSRILTEQAGALVPMKKSKLPTSQYPVLADISRALENPGIDIEVYHPNVSIREHLQRMDDLLLNSMEISIDGYLQKLYEEFAKNSRN